LFHGDFGTGSDYQTVLVVAGDAGPVFFADQVELRLGVEEGCKCGVADWLRKAAGPRMDRSGVCGGGTRRRVSTPRWDLRLLR